MLNDGNGSRQDWAESIGTAFKFVFSWVALMPIAVIISGKLLRASSLKIPGQSKQMFRVPIPRILNLEARGDEVVLGFTTFFVMFLTITIPAGRPAYEMFVRQFGADPGQFNALCILSSFTAVGVCLIYLLAAKGLARVRVRTDRVLREHTRVIEQIAEDGRANR